jgi:hypothetical protein
MALLEYDLTSLPSILLHEYPTLRPFPAVYFVRTAHDILYIGAARNLRNRFATLPQQLSLTGATR